MSRKKVKNKTKRSATSTPRRTPSKHHNSTTTTHNPRVPEAAVALARFSMFDEARWMSNHRSSAFDSARQLRSMPIQFVSAGVLEGTIKETPPPQELVVRGPVVSSPPQAPMYLASPPSPDHTHGIANLTIRSPSPSTSDSSRDEVVFQGRTNTPLHQGAAASTPTVTPRPSEITATVTTEKLKQSIAPSTPQLTTASSDENTSVLADVVAHPSVEVNIRIQPPNPPPQDRPVPDSDEESIAHDVFAKRRGEKPIWEGYTTPWESRSKPGIGWLPAQDHPDKDECLFDKKSSRDAAMDDYMQNLEEFGLTDDMMAASGFARREMDLDAGSHNDWDPETSNIRKESDSEIEIDWDSDMLRDFDGISTSSELSVAVTRILSKRTRPSGLQYLCVYGDATTDDARWVRAMTMNRKAEKQLVQLYEAEMASLARGMDSGSMSMSISDEESDGGDDHTEEEEEFFDDEAIARVLQKQEELGLGSDEVMLYAGDDFFRNPDNFAASAPAFDRPNKKRQSKFSGSHVQPTFPSASAMADALAIDPYNGFDIMDTERPSLRPKKKGRRGQMPPELEDSDLNEQMLRTWEADRNKKRIKKAEREELRQQGLLGRKGKTPDLKVKYKDGISADDILVEIRDFLMSDNQSVSLPPMDAKRRALVHEFVNTIGVNSKSRGAGSDRFTVLSKTARTRIYSNEEFDRVLKHKGFKFRIRTSASTPVQRGQKKHPQVTYKDGDVVGASAPELGSENKGRAMLEKMGWTKGTALGALDNKGILLPIVGTVKTTRAGLK